MDSSTCIEQIGVVDEITDGIAKVTITKYSACADCQSKNACGIINSATRQIFVSVTHDNIMVGESVYIQMDQSIGTKALILAYLLPIFLLLTTLISLSSIKIRELYTGLLSIAILVPYFLGLYLFRHRLKKTFKFRLRKTKLDD